MENKDFILEKKENYLKFRINTKIYPLDAIYRAAYNFIDQVYIYLDGEPGTEIMVEFKAKEKMSGEELEKISADFYNELLNQMLREKVGEVNAKIREYVVSKALYNAVPSEVDELLKEVEEEDWQEDPLGIAKTWEESQAKNEEKGE